ncbi:MAG: Na+/H+ antiporter NhaA [Thalassobius sp.]|nr:Na+/H+ antiporter NhaA [Thalassovita sp.]
MNQLVQKKSKTSYIQETASKFLDRETAGGLILIAATILALIIGNSAWAETYHHILEEKFLFGFADSLTFELTIEQWINDGLMVIFFLVAGLELKREILVGELSSFKKASMPLLAALGGMLMPAVIYTIFNAGSENAHGWGVPMATDIAYSLGIIGLLGKRVPTQVKTFLIALAIADDLGAILVIAFFYSSDISWLHLGISGGLFVMLMAMNKFGFKSLFWYIPVGIVLWYFTLKGGIHPTIAGVLFAISIPVKPKLDSKILKDRTVQNVEKLEHTDIEHRDPMQDIEQREILERMKKDTNKSRPPLIKLENALIEFNTFFVIPIFALANAGVALDINIMEVITGSVGLGIILGLILGKALGISLFSYVGYKLGIAELNKSISWGHILGIGFIAGIGFTMSIFITNLAFNDPEVVKLSKISILIASLIAVINGLVTMLIIKPKEPVT